MLESADKKRIVLFTFFSFLFAWATAYVIYKNGALTQSPVIIKSLNLNLATILMATAYMLAPALAHIITRLITREGWKNVWLKIKSTKSGRFWVLAWILPGILTLLGAAVYFLFFPDSFDPNLSVIQNQLDALKNASLSTQNIPLTPWFIVLIQVVQAFLLAPILNALPVFGEEFGWRAYLLPKLLPLGAKKAILISCVIWGIWHWPLIMMGYNYGLEYSGAPYTGLLAMVIFTIGIGTLISWLTIHAKNIWPAVIAHGAINGIAAIGLIFLKSEPVTLLGPTPVGLLGGIFFTIVAINILFHPTALYNKKNLEIIE